MLRGHLTLQAADEREGMRPPCRHGAAGKHPQQICWAGLAAAALEHQMGAPRLHSACRSPQQLCSCVGSRHEHPVPCLTWVTGDIQPWVIRKLHGVSFPKSLPARCSLGLCLTATGEAARWPLELVSDLSVLRLVSHVQAKLVGQNQAGLELPGPCHSSCSRFTVRQQHCSGSVLLPPGLDPRFPA